MDAMCKFILSLASLAVSDTRAMSACMSYNVEGLRIEAHPARGSDDGSLIVSVESGHIWCHLCLLGFEAVEEAERYAAVPA